jgi:hypothetical protein
MIIRAKFWTNETIMMQFVKCCLVNYCQKQSTYTIIALITLKTVQDIWEIIPVKTIHAKINIYILNCRISQFELNYRASFSHNINICKGFEVSYVRQLTLIETKRN